MKNILSRKIIEVIIFLIYITIINTIQFSMMFSIVGPKYFFLEYLLLLGLMTVICFVKNTLFDTIYIGVLSVIYTTLATINIIYFSFSGDVFSFTLMTIVGGGGLAVLDSSFIDIPLIIIMVIIFVIEITAISLINHYFKTDEEREYFAQRKLLKQQKKEKSQEIAYKKIKDTRSLIKNCSNKKVYIGGGISFIALISIFITSFCLTSLYSEKSFDEAIVIMAKSANFRKYGMLSYYIKEFNYLISGIPTLNENQIDNYFNSNFEDYHNDLSGSMEGKNVVTIMIETGASMIINEELTPNLYNLTKNSIYCENNHSRNKTNVSEFIGMVGSAPNEGIWGQRENRDYYLPFSVMNMLPEEYTSIYIHDTGTEPWDVDLYSRTELMPKLNFDKIYFHDYFYGKDQIWNWDGSYNYDSVTMEKVGDLLVKEDKPFYAFYTSLAMHGPYKERASSSLDYLNGNYRDKLNKAKQDGTYVNPIAVLPDDKKGDPRNEECIDIFMMLAMDFDKGLGIMFDKFAEANMLDDTVFIIYGDHNIYYPGYDETPLDIWIFNCEDKMDREHHEMYSTILMIKNDELTRKYQEIYKTNVVSQFTSPYNIVPSLLDIMGVDYNPNFYLGDSIFSKQFDDIQIFYSLEFSAWFNDCYWSNDCETITSVFDDKKYSKAKFLSAMKKGKLFQSIMNMIYENNYFSNHDYSKYRLCEGI